ncbi:MAG: hypothetical protein KA715_10405 [Xanthomonadaceae bacterium]|nr:hypothetical protein [Xanthomonadaceae bacterium]
MRIALSCLIILIFQAPLTSWGQQNLFNVPSSVLTEKQELFIQEQINNYSDLMGSNLTATYGIGKDYEVGLNFLGIDYMKDSRL